MRSMAPCPFFLGIEELEETSHIFLGEGFVSTGARNVSREKEGGRGVHPRKARARGNADPPGLGIFRLSKRLVSTNRSTRVHSESSSLTNPFRTPLCDTGDHHSHYGTGSTPALKDLRGSSRGCRESGLPFRPGLLSNVRGLKQEPHCDENERERVESRTYRRKRA